jgi:hypothetical protein
LGYVLLLSLTMRGVHSARIPFLLNSDEARLLHHVLCSFYGSQGRRFLRCLYGSRLLDGREGPLGDGGFLYWLRVRELLPHSDDLLEVQLIHKEVLLLLRQGVQMRSQGEWLRF